MRATARVVVVGAGIGGLAAALDLARLGFEVTVVERAPSPGGKLRVARVAGHPIDAGPTVLTMRWVFDSLFGDAGESLDSRVGLTRAEILARHAWSEGERLDLYADLERSAAAIGDFAGAEEARGFLAFSARARATYAALEKSYIQSADPTPLSLSFGAGLKGLGDLWRIAPFTTLWSALGNYFRDPRLRQLFGRYATYCGSSPFCAPATLMLIAHVEQDGVWLVEGGLHQLAATLAALAAQRGATFRYASEVREIRTGDSGVTGVALGTGEFVEADAVVVNADVGALAAGCFGDAAAGAVPRLSRASRSLSAITWACVAKTDGFPLTRHNVFFSGDYPAEFESIFGQHRIPDSPTVYVCAQDRDAADQARPEGSERLLVLINAPAVGDTESITEKEIEQCTESAFGQLRRCGLSVHLDTRSAVTTTPSRFEALYPATGGALYGQASHGWAASFTRPRAKTRLPGLYLAGGSVHPGPGLPMAALSGRMAAASLAADLASRPSFRRAGISGGTRTR